MAAQAIKAVVFDADGTLLNSKELIFAAYQHVARAHGLVPPTPAEIMVHMGKSLRDIYLGLFPEADPDELVRANGEFVVRNRLKVQGFEGLEETLQAMRAAGLSLGIVTGGDHKAVELLEHHGLAPFFMSVVHSERIAKQKPDPEGVLLALRELGCQPQQALMVGDMRYDILAGKNAGVHATIGVTHGFGTRKELETAGADYIVDSLPSLLELVQDNFIR
jgi:pyrophosphatase PpaX